MNRTELAARHAEIIRRHFRELEDRPGRVPPRLLDDLADVADEHAIDENLAAVNRALAARGVPLTDDTGHPVRPDGSVIEETSQAAERRAARTGRTRKPAGASE